MLAHLLPTKALSNNPVILASGAHAASDIVRFDFPKRNMVEMCFSFMDIESNTL